MIGSRPILLTSVVLILLGGAPATRLIGGANAWAQQRQPGTSPGQPQMNMQDMMKMHEQMMADMKAANAKLDQLTQKMDSATGQAKVDATAALVKELVTQHRAAVPRCALMPSSLAPVSEDRSAPQSWLNAGCAC